MLTRGLRGLAAEATLDRMSRDTPVSWANAQRARSLVPTVSLGYAAVRTIIVGDVHGCIDEFRELLRLVEYRRGRDRLVQLGDLIDRGPDPVGCVRFAREQGVEALLGNHEEKALRWLRHEAQRGALRNPMRSPPPERIAEWQALSEDDVRWLRDAPLMLRLGERGDWLAVHGGLLPGIPLAAQPPDVVVRCRYVDAEGRHASLEPGNFGAPAGAVPWMQRWDGAVNVVYGHAVDSLRFATITDRPGGIRCVGLDTGCVYGGHLSAMTLPGAITIVKAAREYFPRERARE